MELGRVCSINNHSIILTETDEGPCRVLDSDGPQFHPESWNSNANIFFIDQPIGVGFSYAEYGETVVRVLSYLKGAIPTVVHRVRLKKLLKMSLLSLPFSLRTLANSKEGRSTWQESLMA